MIPIHEDTKAQARGKVKKDIERYVYPKDVLPCAKAKIQYKWNSHDIAEMNQKHGGCHTCIHMCGIHKWSDTVDTGAWMPSVTSWYILHHCAFHADSLMLLRQVQQCCCNCCPWFCRSFSLLDSQNFSAVLFTFASCLYGFSPPFIHLSYLVVSR